MTANQSNKEENTSSRILGPAHIWALGVGIVLVGEFMGWNNSILRGGSLSALSGLWIIAVMYICLIMMTTEMASVMPEAGGQYTMAKYTLGPLGAFNVGLMLVFEYAMLEAADALVVGQILKAINPGFTPLPYIILALLLLSYVNYKGAKATFTLNLIITAIAFVSIMILLFSTHFYDPQATLIHLESFTNELPYGYLGLLAAMQFCCWFYLGIEGTALAADECRSPARALPVGAFLGIATLLIGGTVTWFVCTGLLPESKLGGSVYPIFDAALATGKLFVIVSAFTGTILACLASANGCINDASRAWSAMSKDMLLPDYFGKMHPKFGSPYRSILFLLPISIAFAFTGMLDQVVTFSIFSALLVYLLTCIMMVRFRRMYPPKTLKRPYKASFYPLPVFICGILVLCVLFGMQLTYSVNMAAGFLFYFLASIWFCRRRLPFVRKDEFMKKGNQAFGRPGQI